MNINYKQLFLKISIILLAGSGFFTLSGCGKKEQVESVALARPVKIVELESGGIGEKVELPAQIRAALQANMAFEVSGQMTEVLVEEGVMVQKGDLLARLDERDYEANRAAAAAQYEVAEVEATRAEALYARQATSKQRVDIAVSNLKVAKAALDKADKAYNDTFMRAPISGTIAKILVDDIVNVQAKQDILIIHDNSVLKAVVDVPETLSALAKPGLSLATRNEHMEPMVYLSFLPLRGFPAKISEVSAMADATTRTYEATFSFDPPEDVIILPGMTAKVIISLPKGPRADITSYALPINSVGSDAQGNPFVWVVDSSSMTVARISVETGVVSGSWIEVNSDNLKEGDWVVTSGVHNLLPGDQVRKFER